MAFGRFKEANETDDTKEINENKESSLDNSDKRRIQILENPDDYDDDFDSKLDSNENKEKILDRKEGGEEKQGLFDRIKDIFSKDKLDEAKEKNEADDTPDTNDEPVKSRAESFRESMKVPNPEECKKYNEEHGYADTVMERPKGGVERVRGGDDPRWEDDDTNENFDDTDNLENN